MTYEQTQRIKENCYAKNERNAKKITTKKNKNQIRSGQKMNYKSNYSVPSV